MDYVAGHADPITNEQLCRVCNWHGAGNIYTASEQMLGLGGSFHYRECFQCRSLVLLDPPDSLVDYYPNEYGWVAPFSDNAAEKVRRTVLLAIDRTYWKFPGLAKLGGGASVLGIMSRANTALSARVLDVGCGDGDLLRRLYRLGFSQLTGIDPYPRHGSYPSGPFKFKAVAIEAVGEQFDAIIFRDTLEHMLDPDAVLCSARSILAPGGVVIVSIPVPNHCWRTYRTSWFGLDAPRHITLFSNAGFVAAARRAGFRLESYVYDGAAMDFWASELYGRGNTLAQIMRDYWKEPPLSMHWLWQQLRICGSRAKAMLLNLSGRGDHATFSLRAIK